jgi:hypothetical protein
VSRRSQVQLVLLVVGVITWGFGQRIDDSRVRWAGIACFAVATALRFAKRPPEPRE